MNATEKAVVVERAVRLVKMPGFDAAVDGKAEHREVMSAIGYLSQWALHSGEKRIVKVSIGLYYNGDMGALYRDADDQIVYEIVAILREDGKYSFHS